MPDATLYQDKLSNPEACVQNIGERLQSYMGRLEEWFEGAYPESYKTLCMRQMLCKKFYEGLSNRDLACEIAKSKTGYEMIYVSGSHLKLLELTIETSMILQKVRESETLIQQAHLGEGNEY